MMRYICFCLLGLIETDLAPNDLGAIQSLLDLGAIKSLNIFVKFFNKKIGTKITFFEVGKMQEKYYFNFFLKKC